MGYIKTGSFLRRFILGGTQLNKFENFCLSKLVELLPKEIKEILIAQLYTINLVQREVGGRTLNFYATKLGRVNWKNTPLFSTRKSEVKLLKLELEMQNKKKVHVNFWVVNGIFFQITFSSMESTYSGAVEENITINKVKQSWRSDIII